jgi:hypothetical protein
MFCRAPKEMRNKPGNPRISRIWLCLHTPVPAILAHQSPKVSGHLRDYSRFVETAARDWGRLARRGPLCSHSTAVSSRSLAKSGIAGRPLRDESYTRFRALIRFRLLAYQLADGGCVTGKESAESLSVADGKTLERKLIKLFIGAANTHRTRFSTVRFSSRASHLIHAASATLLPTGLQRVRMVQYWANRHLGL